MCQETIDMMTVTVGSALWYGQIAKLVMANQLHHLTEGNENKEAISENFVGE